jgi:hypothetical protein
VEEKEEEHEGISKEGLPAAAREGAVGILAGGGAQAAGSGSTRRRCSGAPPAAGRG